MQALQKSIWGWLRSKKIFNAIQILLLSAAWGQALPLGEDIFLPLALMTFLGIRPDPDILAGPLRGLPSRTRI